MDYLNFCRRYQINSLNEQQESAVKETDGAILLLAVPGAGKTTVIITRVAFMVAVKKIHPKSILTLTYTKAAATEMKERFQRRFPDIETPHFSTINSFCVSVLRKCEREKGAYIPELEPNTETIIRKIAASMMHEYPSDGTLRDLSSAITKVKNLMLSDSEIEQIENNELSFADFYSEYQRQLRDAGRMDFDDQLVYAYSMLQQYPDLLQRAREQYRYIQVDEAQDTSLIQHRLLQLLAGRNGNIMMVGDEDQSIYSFRGAAPKCLLTFPVDYANAKVMYMETNYRSCRSIVEVMNQFIRKNPDRNEKDMVAFSGTNGTLEVSTIANHADTPQFLFQTILSYLKEPTVTLAILFRNNESVAPLINLLQTNNIRVRTRDNLKLFLTNYIVTDIRALLELATAPDNFAAFRKVYYKMGLYLKASTLPRIQELNGKHHSVMEAIMNLPESDRMYQTAKSIKAALLRAGKSDPLTAIKIIVNECGYGTWLIEKSGNGMKVGDTIINRIDTLRTIARNYRTIPEFLKALDGLNEYDQDPNSSVTLTTIHSAKGLEFSTVILMDCFDGVLPSADSDKKTQDDINEEVRLFYVAVTRAKHECYLVSPQAWFGRKIEKSVFVTAVEEGKRKLPRNKM